MAAIAVAVAVAALVAVATAAGWSRIGDTLSGFRLDRDTLEVFGDDERRVVNRVLVLGALEYAVLASAACACAIVLLLMGGRGVLPSMLWPWALAVPAGFAVAFVLERRRERLAEGGKVRRALARVLEPITLLRTLVTERDCGSSWPAMILYWVGEVAALGGALATVGASLSVWALVVAFATGHAATRRSLPLGGAGATEALLAYGLHWCGVALAPAVIAVAVFRALGYALPLVPALAARRSVPVLREAAAG